MPPKAITSFEVRTEQAETVLLPHPLLGHIDGAVHLSLNASLDWVREINLRFVAASVARYSDHLTDTLLTGPSRLVDRTITLWTSDSTQRNSEDGNDSAKDDDDTGGYNVAGLGHPAQTGGPRGFEAGEYEFAFGLSLPGTFPASASAADFHVRYLLVASIVWDNVICGFPLPPLIQMNYAPTTTAAELVIRKLPHATDHTASLLEAPGTVSALHRYQRDQLLEDRALFALDSDIEIDKSRLYKMFNWVEIDKLMEFKSHHHHSHNNNINSSHSHYNHANHKHRRRSDPKRKNHNDDDSGANENETIRDNERHEIQLIKPLIMECRSILDTVPVVLPDDTNLNETDSLRQTFSKPVNNQGFKVEHTESSSDSNSKNSNSIDSKLNSDSNNTKINYHSGVLKYNIILERNNGEESSPSSPSGKVPKSPTSFFSPSVSPTATSPSNVNSFLSNKSKIDTDLQSNIKLLDPVELHKHGLPKNLLIERPPVVSVFTPTVWSLTEDTIPFQLVLPRHKVLLGRSSYGKVLEKPKIDDLGAERINLSDYNKYAIYDRVRAVSVDFIQHEKYSYKYHVKNGRTVGVFGDKTERKLSSTITNNFIPINVIHETNPKVHKRPTSGSDSYDGNEIDDLSDIGYQSHRERTSFLLHLPIPADPSFVVDPIEGQTRRISVHSFPATPQFGTTDFETQASHNSFDDYEVVQPTTAGVPIQTNIMHAFTDFSDRISAASQSGSIMEAARILRTPHGKKVLSPPRKKRGHSDETSEEHDLSSAVRDGILTSINSVIGGVNRYTASGFNEIGTSSSTAISTGRRRRSRDIHRHDLGEEGQDPDFDEVSEEEYEEYEEEEAGADETEHIELLDTLNVPRTYSSGQLSSVGSRTPLRSAGHTDVNGGRAVAISDGGRRPISDNQLTPGNMNSAFGEDDITDVNSFARILMGSPKLISAEDSDIRTVRSVSPGKAGKKKLRKRSLLERGIRRVCFFVFKRSPMGQIYVTARFALRIFNTIRYSVQTVNTIIDKGITTVHILRFPSRWNKSLLAAHGQRPILTPDDVEDKKRIVVYSEDENTETVKISHWIRIKVVMSRSIYTRDCPHCMNGKYNNSIIDGESPHGFPLDHETPTLPQSQRRVHSEKNDTFYYPDAMNDPLFQQRPLVAAAGPAKSGLYSIFSTNGPHIPTETSFGEDESSQLSHGSTDNSRVVTAESFNTHLSHSSCRCGHEDPTTRKKPITHIIEVPVVIFRPPTVTAASQTELKATNLKVPNASGQHLSNGIPENLRRRRSSGMNSYGEQNSRSVSASRDPSPAPAPTPSPSLLNQDDKISQAGTNISEAINNSSSSRTERRPKGVKTETGKHKTL